MAFISSSEMFNPSKYPPQDSIIKMQRPLEINEALTQPGVRLIMPSEQSEDFINGRQGFNEFNRATPSGGDSAESHKTGETFARVYANEFAEPFMTKSRVRFPVGSIIVREKLWQATSTVPARVTAMFKRERGFSPRTNDWEFFVIDRNLGRIKDRDTVGNCASCHINSKETDWVYKTYVP